MKKFYSALIVTCFFALSVNLSAQLVVAASGNGNSLAQTLAGNGVTISNVVMNCPTGAAGTFTGTNTSLGMGSGIVLTSGDVTLTPGPNNTSGAGLDNSGGGDADLDNLTSSSTFDACVLEFDMQVLSDSVEFKYSFGSEEYLEYVNGGYNDVFGFFISGPGIAGSQNIALVPGTTTPVSIDNVNNVNYPQYYVDNGDGFTTPQSTSNYYIQYDGFTRVLTAKKKGLQPCQTYHLKLAVSDAGDGVLDSGVFLEANSLTSNFVSLDSVETDVPNVSNAIEGCVRGKIRFDLETPVNAPTTVQYQIGGTATNGVDYQQIPTSITIPAGDTVAVLNITTIADGLSEGTETVKIYLLTACNNTPYDSVTLLIQDNIHVQVSPLTSNICAGDQVQLTATGASSYTWSPAATLSAGNIANPIATPTVTTVYKCSSSIGQCVSVDSLTVNVVPAPFSVNAGPDLASCSGSSVQLNAIVNGTTFNGNPFVYAWSPGGGISNTTILNPVATPPNSPSTYVLEVTSGNCRARDTVIVAVGNLQLTVNTTNESCYGYHNGTASVTVTTGATPYQYIWSTGATTSSITGLAGGTYLVSVTDNSGCSASVSLNVVGVTAPLSVNAGPDILDCQNTSVQLNAVVTGNPVNGNPFIYQWSPAATLSNGNAPNPIATPTGPTQYVIRVLSGACEVRDTVNVTLGNLQISTSATNETCYGYLNGTADVTILAGSQPYQYIWSNNATTANLSGIGGGTYTVTVLDVNGCSATGSATVLSTNPIHFSQPVVGAIKCFGGTDGTITLTAAGGVGNINYLWNTGATTPSITNLSANTPYILTATDANTCQADTTVTLTDPAQIVLNVTPTDISCHGAGDGICDAAVSGGTAPYAFVWNTSQTTPSITGLPAGNYQVSVTDANNCSTSSSAAIVEPALISVTAASMAPSCPGINDGTIDAGATNGFSPYTFELIYNNSSVGINQTGTFRNLGAGDYRISVTDDHQCNVVANLNLLQPIPDEFIFSADSTSCYGSSYLDGQVHVVAVSILNQPYIYSIDGGNPQYDGDFLTLGAGAHTVTIANSRGCITTQSVTVPEPAEGIAQITPGDSSIQIGGTTQLFATINNYTQAEIKSYSWGPFEGLNCTDCANPMVTGYSQNEYTLTLVYGNNCIATASTLVNVTGYPEIFIPNAFSPNGDGNNDVFLIYGAAVKTVSLTIYNRWGELIFDSGNQFNGWDGHYKGQLQNPNVYTYVAGITYLDGKEIQKKGSFTLVR
ncbi:MAG: choice-of-anchor L domain-containing protein [Chitinophagales bacterium]